MGGFLRSDCTGYLTGVLKRLDSTCILGFLCFKDKTAATSSYLLEGDHTKEVSANPLRAYRGAGFQRPVSFHYVLSNLAALFC